MPYKARGEIESIRFVQDVDDVWWGGGLGGSWCVSGVWGMDS